MRLDVLNNIKHRATQRNKPSKSYQTANNRGYTHTNVLVTSSRMCHCFTYILAKTTTTINKNKIASATNSKCIFDNCAIFTNTYATMLNNAATKIIKNDLVCSSFSFTFSFISAFYTRAIIAFADDFCKQYEICGGKK